MGAVSESAVWKSAEIQDVSHCTGTEVTQFPNCVAPTLVCFPSSVLVSLRIASRYSSHVQGLDHSAGGTGTPAPWKAGRL